MVTLTTEECKAIYELMGDLSGCNPEYVFAWDGTDDPNCVITRAAAKLYKAAGKRIPKEMEEVVNEP